MKRSVTKRLSISACLILVVVISYAYINTPQPSGNVTIIHSQLKAWDFYIDKNKKWKWINVKTTDGEIIKASTKSFDTEKECIEDAEKNGYSN